MDSKLDDFSKMQLKLVEHGNVLPIVGAQNPILDYVSFFVVPDDRCVNAYCVNIDREISNQEEFAYWMVLVLVAILGVGTIVTVLLWRKISSSETDKTGYLQKINNPY